MELSQEFSLGHEFRWEEPIGEMAQVSIATYGCDDDRMHLANHFSASAASLEAMSLLLSPEVRLEVANNPHTPTEALKRLARDHSRAVRAAAIHTISGLPEHLRAAAMPSAESPLQKLRSRRGA
jgi:Leucine rich repeat variant